VRGCAGSPKIFNFGVRYVRGWPLLNIFWGVRIDSRVVRYTLSLGFNAHAMFSSFVERDNSLYLNMVRLYTFCFITSSSRPEKHQVT